MIRKDRICIKCGCILANNRIKSYNGYCDQCLPVIDTYMINHGLSLYKDILAHKLIDLECKHILYLTDDNKHIYDQALHAHYPQLQWGYYRDVPATAASEIAIIDKMITDEFYKPIKIVITDNHIWTDNTHTAISYIRRYGRNVCIQDIPFYICDVRSSFISISASKQYLIFDEACILTALRKAVKLKYLEANGGRIDNWTIKDLASQLFYIMK